MFSFLKQQIRPYLEENLNDYCRHLALIREKEALLKGQSDHKLKSSFQQVRTEIAGNMEVENWIPDVYAHVSEVVFRTLGMRLYDVQLLAALALNASRIVEMQTGEGKTLTATLPAIFHAIQGKRVHILTFNDYLAQRDAKWMGPVYAYLECSVGYVGEHTPENIKTEVYQNDIVYLTAKQAGFDYLRDSLRQQWHKTIQPSVDFAIVDEADSILIDEARIPMVIAGATTLAQPDYLHKVSHFAKNMVSEKHFQKDKFDLSIHLNEMGIEAAEAYFDCNNLYDPENESLLAAINHGLHASWLLKKDVDYIVRDDRIELVDEFTGRVMDNRKWPYGLHAALEAKEALVIAPEGKILGKTNLQHYVRRYKKLSGMTGTARTSAEEFADLYGLVTTIVPPNRPNVRFDYEDLIYYNQQAKFQAIIKEIVEAHKTGRPILVGTPSVADSEKLSLALNKSGIDHQLLNAKNDVIEAAIVANAGKLGKVTISTNMAGRGTDIKLGGETGENRQQIIEMGGLYVIGTHRFESRRVDDQLKGRAGRQGDPGSTRFFVSLEDDLLEKHGLRDLLPARILKQDLQYPIESRIVRREVNRAQRIIEGKNFDIRKTLIKYALITDWQWKVILEMRDEFLLSHFDSLAKENDPQFYEDLVQTHGISSVTLAEQQVAIAIIDKYWSEHLEATDEIRQAIHLQTLGGLNPFIEFQKIMVDCFDDLLARIKQKIVEKMYQVRIVPEGVDLEKEGLLRPTSTWTYLVNDNPFGDRLQLMLMASGNIGFAALSMLIYGPIIMFYFIINKFKNRKKG